MPSASAYAQGVIEEIVVTAQKREQSREDIGMAISVLGEDALSEQRIVGLDSLSRNIPSLDIYRGNGSNNPTITLRGIGTTNPWVNNNPSVAVHADGVYLPMSAYLTFPLFDLQRVEVLKGPQIGLYGRNSTAGAINFVSRRPAPETSGYVDVSYGNYDAINLEAAIGGALTDTVEGRFAALYQDGGGYMDRPGTVDSTAGFTRVPGVVPPVPEVGAEDDYGDKDVLAFRGSLAFDFSENFDALVSIHYAQDDSEIVGSTNINGDILGVFQPPADEPYKDYDNVEPFNDSEQLGGVVELNWRLGDYLLTSITGIETLEREYNIGDFVPIRVAEASFDEELQSLYQEVRLDYQADPNLRWLVGVSYTDDDIDYNRVLTAYDLLLGALGTRFDQDDESYAFFGQVEWQLDPAWQITGSLRYTDEEKRYDGGSFDIDPFGVSAVGSAFPNVVPDGLFDQRVYDEDDLSGRTSLQWEPTDGAMYYVSVARAFKSGGFDGSGITEPASFTPYGAETVWAYEAGTKLKLLEDRLFVSASVFRNDYTDKQVLSLQDLGTGIVEAIIQNAAESEITGLDVEADWLVGPALTLSLRGTWLDSEITGWDSADPAEVQARVGNELPGTPEFSATASATWEAPITGQRTLTVRGWATYTEEAFRDIENSETSLSEDHGTVNLRIGLNDSAGWSVYAFGENLLDEEYVTSRRVLVGMVGEYYGPPRTYGIGFRYNMTQ
ncbi:TonB-dependent receptor [Lentisalinibacter salinarum]|uniref:TonB-dependent receptor n=1 Tax=Lentisalinibacter salinarum TaxID=2992239 RepID=UPI003867B52F